MNAIRNKGFTLVELVIVIAVIAILAAVLVPTFSNVVENANVSSDKSLVRNINNVLEIKGSLNQLPNDKTELKKVLKEYGINETKNKAKNHFIFWSKSQNMFFIWGIKEQEIIFPEYCRGMNLDDFDDEVNINFNEVNNLKNMGIKHSIPNTGIEAYCNEYKNDWILSDKDKRIIQGNGFVTVGTFMIEPEKHNSFTIYISGVEINGDGYCRMHIFKESDLSSPTIYTNLDNGFISNDWGFEIVKISENNYKITFDINQLIKKSTTGNQIEKIYYALTLKGNGDNLVITHNEEILNID